MAGAPLNCPPEPMSLRRLRAGVPGANIEEAHNDLYEQLRKRITLLFNET